MNTMASSDFCVKLWKVQVEVFPTKLESLKEGFLVC